MYFKILVISEQYWPKGSGRELATHLIARILRDAGFKLTVAHGTRQPETVEGIDYVYTPLLSVRNKYRLWLNCLILTKQAWFLEAMRKCDVVYVPRYCYPLIPLAKRLGKGVVVHLHDYQPISYNAVVFNGMKRNSFSLNDVVRFEILEHNSILRATFGALTAPINKLCRLWLSEADVVICVSKRQAEIISSSAPELAPKIKVVYNPLPETPPIEEKFKNSTFTYPGGGSYVKGFHIFMRGALSLLRRGDSADFLLTGGLRGFGHEHKEWLGKLNDSLKGKFKLLGRLPYEDVLRLYSKSHAVLVPSIWEEPLPYVVAEAMAMGTVPIASRIGGIPEIIQETYAEKMMFSPGNVDEFAEKMGCVLSLSKEQVLDIGIGLRESVLKRFSRDPIRSKLLNVFSIE